MKKLLLLLMVVGVANIVSAQKNFEGKITYHLSRTIKLPDNLSDATISIYYGKQKAKAIITDPANTITGKDDIVIDFTDNTIMHINAVEKKYSKKPLKKSQPGRMMEFILTTEKNKTIAGIFCNAFAVADKNIVTAGEMGFTFWYADSLSFLFDRSYFNDDLMLFSNGTNVFMGMQLKTDSGSLVGSMEVTATAIERKEIADSTFIIPGDYVKDTNAPAAINEIENAQSDSVKIMAESAIDSAIRAVTESVKLATKRSTKKSSRQNSKMQQPQKNSATKPKE